MASAPDKAALLDRVANGKTMRKDAQSFVKSLRKSAQDMMSHVNKAITKQEKEQVAKIAAEEASIIRAEAAVQQHEHPRASDAIGMGDVLALFAAQPHGQAPDAPELVTYNAKTVADFDYEWIKSQCDGSAQAGKDLPFGLSAEPWVQMVKALPPVASAFGCFAADYLGSAEYHSKLGRAQSTLTGCSSVGVALRKVIVLPQSKCVTLTKQVLTANVKNGKKEGLVKRIFKLFETHVHSRAMI